MQDAPLANQTSDDTKARTARSQISVLGGEEARHPDREGPISGSAARCVAATYCVVLLPIRVNTVEMGQ